MYISITITLIANVIISLAAGISAYYLILQYIPIFVNRGLYGTDLCKVCFIF